MEQPRRAQRPSAPWAILAGLGMAATLVVLLRLIGGRRPGWLGLLVAMLGLALPGVIALLFALSGPPFLY